MNVTWRSPTDFGTSCTPREATSPVMFAIQQSEVLDPPPATLASLLRTGLLDALSAKFAVVGPLAVIPLDVAEPELLFFVTAS